MPLGMEIGLGPGDFVLDGDPALPPPKVGTAPQFSTDVNAGQTVGYIRVPLGTDVDLGPGDIVLDADPAPPKGGTDANFRPMSIVTKRLE